MVEEGDRGGYGPKTGLSAMVEDEGGKRRGSTVCIFKGFTLCVGRDSSVGIATCYGLGGPWFESR